MFKIKKAAEQLVAFFINESDYVKCYTYTNLIVEEASRRCVVDIYCIVNGDRGKNFP